MDRTPLRIPEDKLDHHFAVTDRGERNDSPKFMIYESAEAL